MPGASRLRMPAPGEPCPPERSSRSRRAESLTKWIYFFGERADWFHNVQAAGGCVIRWKGANYPLIDPEVVDWATVRSAFYPVERVVMPIIGIEQFVRLRHAPSSSDVSQN